VSFFCPECGHGLHFRKGDFRVLYVVRGADPGGHSPLSLFADATADVLNGLLTLTPP
jgi:hypothetical protein